jgi:hypothetical protein
MMRPRMIRPRTKRPRKKRPQDAASSGRNATGDFKN